LQCVKYWSVKTRSFCEICGNQNKATGIIQKITGTLNFTTFKTLNLALRILGVEEEPFSETLVFLYKFTWNYPKRSVGDDFN
jgi:hypothetical protein